MEWFIVFLILGAVVGVFAGLLGIGGGMIIVPVMTYVLQQQGVEPGLAIKLALGTSLASIILTSCSSVWAHHRRGAVRWDLVKKLSPGIVIGTLLGARVVALLPGKELKIFFAVFMIVMALRMAFSKNVLTNYPLPSNAKVATAGGVIGLLSAMVGIGGGSLTVPYVARYGVEIHKAMATSSACGLPLAIAGTIGYLINGWNIANLPPHCLGFIHLTGLVGIACTSMLFAPLGARLAHHLPVKILKRVFAGFLCIIAISMVVK